jgi:hypothetical protein
MHKLMPPTLAAALLALFASAAVAQPFSPTLNPTAAPITINQAPEKLKVRPTIASQNLLTVALGATLNAGNTETYAGNAGGRYGLIRDRHQLTLEVLGTAGGTREGLTKVDWTSHNVLGRARYDIFVSLTDALFVAMVPRRDIKAGLDLRLQTQTGYLRNLFMFSEAHRFWTELGYDFSYDNYAELSEEDLAKLMMDNIKPGSSSNVHSARMFFGYANRLSPTANVNIGAEVLLDFQDYKNVRVNGLAELTSSITHSFKLGVQSRLLYDNVPAPGIKSDYDLIALVQLVYTFDSAAVTSTVCPACDCSAQVQAARASCRPSEPLRQIAP